MKLLIFILGYELLSTTRTVASLWPYWPGIGCDYGLYKLGFGGYTLQSHLHPGKSEADAGAGAFPERQVPVRRLGRSLRGPLHEALWKILLRLLQPTKKQLVLSLPKHALPMLKARRHLCSCETDSPFTFCMDFAFHWQDLYLLGSVQCASKTTA